MYVADDHYIYIAFIISIYGYMPHYSIKEWRFLYLN